MKGTTMLKYLVLSVITLATVCASGDFVILHSPDSVVFNGNEKIEQSILKDVFAAALGFTVKQRETWNGISIKDPFQLPEAMVCLAVEGIDSLDAPRGKKYPLVVDEVEETTWQAVSGRLNERDNDNTLIRIYLGDGVDALGHSALGELKPAPIDETSLKALSLENEEDRKFLEEVQLLYAIASKIPSVIKADDKPDVYWLVISELRPIFDLHGKNSSAAKEALSLLNNALDVISQAFIKSYDGKVVIAAFTNDASQVRHSRSLDRQRRDVEDDKNRSIESTAEAKRVANNTEYIDNKIANKQGELQGKNVGDGEATDTNTDSSTNENVNDISSSTEYNAVSDDSGRTENSDQDLTNTEYSINTNTQKTGQIKRRSKKYSENYPVIFNILLWFGVVFVFSLLAVCIAIADMDPGRDSIIYRMTSNRMKKDN